MKKHIKKIIIIALLAVVAYGVYHFFMKEKPYLNGIHSFLAIQIP